MPRGRMYTSSISTPPKKDRNVHKIVTYYFCILLGHRSSPVIGASALGSPSSAANEAPACSAGVMIDLGGAAIFSGSWGPVTSPTALLNLLVIIGDRAIHVNVDYVLRYLLVTKMGLERRHLQLSATAPRSNAGTIHCPARTGNMKRVRIWQTNRPFAI